MIKASFDKTQYGKFMAALKGVESAAKREAVRMPRRCATDYQLALIEAVVTQKYSFPKFSERYEKWKAKQSGVTMPDFWKLHGDFIKSLTVFKHSEGGLAGWVGGIAPGALNREGKLVKMYAVPNERLRPVFEMTRGDYIQSGWRQRGRESLKSIASAWR